MKKKIGKFTAMLLALLLTCWQPGFLSAAKAETAGTAEAAAETAENSSDTGEGTSGNGSEGALEQEDSAVTVTWPELDQEIQAGSAIVMDADTGEVLWGKEIHTKRYPASITKLLTALIVIENCSLDETVTFSPTAVNNLESGAVTIGAVAGDELSVKDCLYALLLKSANEVANALAEHVSGSVSDFALLMNQRAQELGCQNSDFRNPSGLTDSEHVTSAYDMGLIGMACMNNKTFLELESQPTRKLAGTSKYPDGLTVTIGHKMRNEGSEYYDSRVIAGKTGYTSASGNTLVTMAADGGRRVVVVVLKDKTPAHYTDTGKLLDFGLNRFDLLTPSLNTLKETADLEARLIKSGAIQETDPSTGESNALSLSEVPQITVPRGAGLQCVEAELSRNLSPDAPEKAVALLRLSCLGHQGPQVYVLNTYTPPESENEEVDVLGGPESEKDETTAGDEAGGSGSSGPGLLAWILIILLITAAGFATVWYLQKRKEEKRRLERRRKRKERLARLEPGEGQHRRYSHKAGEKKRPEREQELLTSLSEEKIQEAPKPEQETEAAGNVPSCEGTSSEDEK